MKVSGFTFLRNAVMNGYPFEESIKSILPLVDEYVCVVGIGEDDTIDRVAAISDRKIRILETSWNENMTDRGFVYGQQKMIGQYNCSGDWLFYLEGDEVLHEAQLSKIYAAMERDIDDLNVEALYFDFLHFYGTPDQIGIGGYRRAPRILRNNIRAIAPDGLFWVVLDKNKKGRYPKAKSANAQIFHYGHCRKVPRMDEKLRQVGKYWGSNHSTFRGYGSIDVAELRPFIGSHPAVMRDWLSTECEHVFIQDGEYKVSFRDLRNRVRFFMEDAFGIEVSKKHYKAVD